MSFHRNPRYQIPALIEALKAHGMEHDKPSQLADAFRCGWVAGQDAAQGWISVTDRLPEKYEEVMVWPHPGDYCMTGQFGLSGWTYGEYDRYGAQTVPMRDPTHWMPLPKAPT